jgi:hypothetical protein
VNTEKSTFSLFCWLLGVILKKNAKKWDKVVESG